MWQLIHWAVLNIQAAPEPGPLFLKPQMKGHRSRAGTETRRTYKGAHKPVLCSLKKKMRSARSPQEKGKTVSYFGNLRTGPVGFFFLGKSLTAAARVQPGPSGRSTKGGFDVRASVPAGRSWGSSSVVPICWGLHRWGGRGNHAQC